jgi:uncharacterized protein YdhG (YjbR/CyaY superfamily)
MKKGKLKTMDEYIESAPPKTQAKLRQMRASIRSAAPEAREDLKWSMPAFVGSKILVMFAGFKNHIGFFPTPAAVKAFAKELSKYKTGKGSIQFPLDQRLPLPLIKKITRFRVQECETKGKKWRTTK